MIVCFFGTTSAVECKIFVSWTGSFHEKEGQEEASIDVVDLA